VAPDVTFRDMTTRDIPDGLRLCRAAGWNQLEDDWRTLLAPPSVFRLAQREGHALGSAGAVAYGDALAWVCMVLVDPAARGHGLGTALVVQVLDRLSSFGGVVGLDATPKGRPVYARLGFVDAGGFVRLERPPGAPTLSGPGDEARTVRALAPGDVPAVLAMDLDAFGADRSRVLRRQLAAAPESALVLDSGGRIEGYCLGRPGHRAAQVGPVVARNVAQARRMVSALLAARPDQHLFLDAPDRPDWRRSLEELGFAPQRPFTRMYQGAAAAPGRPDRHFAIVGPEFG